MFNIDIKSQNIFAKLSGDYNPIHVDELYAYNSMFGKQIVHGIHQLFCVLEDFSKSFDKQFFISDIDVKFENVLGICENFEITKDINGNLVKYQLINSDKQILSTVCFSYEEKYFECNYFNKKQEYIKTPENPDKYNFANLSEPLFYDEDILNELFPYVKKCLNPINIATFLASTRIIGMKYPGLNSIYNSLQLNFNSNCQACQQNLLYAVSDKYIKFKIIDINIHSDFVTGKLKSFIRPTIEKQKDLVELSNYMPSELMKNQRALIIGGTKGIGLQCLRLLALGGADILFTYYKNKNEALKIKEELKKEHIDVNLIQLDINSLNQDVINAIKKFNPTHLYYFATPKILKHTGTLKRELLITFIDYYIVALANILDKINTIKYIFTPSTVYVDEIKNSLSEYCIAKSAMEEFGKIINKNNIKAYMPRFPRIATSQTLSLIEEKGLCAEDVLLDALTKFTSL